MDAVAHFDRIIRRFGVRAWTAGRTDLRAVFGGKPQPVLSLIASSELTAWIAHYRAAGLVSHDPLAAYGRGPNPAAAADTIVGQTATPPDHEHGYTSGMIVPLHPMRTGAFVTLWEVDPDILAHPEGSTWQEVVGYCFFLGAHGDFAGGVRLHAAGECLSEREAAVVRCLLAGRSVDEAAADLGIQPRSVTSHLDRVRRRLIAARMMPDWAVRVAVPFIAEDLGLLP